MSCPSDRVIQSTNDDATYSKAHAVKRGYWKDPYMRYFCPVATSKPPEISRGYFIRTQAFKAITTLFIKTLGCECQVVNLGAGSDTLYFQLKDADIVPRKFVEVDLLHNVQRKVQLIRSKKLLGEVEEHAAMNLPPQGDSQSKMNPPAVPDTVLEAQNRHSLVTDTYSLVPFDLRRPVDQLISYLCGPNSSIGLDSNLPTLFLADFPTPRDREWISNVSKMRIIQHGDPQGRLIGIKNRFLLLPPPFSQVNMADQFGKIMVENFRARDCDLPGLSACQSLKQQETRFLDAGWQKAKAWTVNEVYKAFPKATRLRSDAIKDRFYDGLNALLRRTKSSDIAVVPGDMNAQLGRPSVSETQLGGRHGLDSGCILSPFLFNCVIDQILKRTVEGLQNNGVEIAANEDLVDLEYTNDIVLVFEEEGKAQVFLNELTPNLQARVAFANLRHLWCQSGASLNLKDMCIGATARAVLQHCLLGLSNGKETAPGLWRQLESECSVVQRGVLSKNMYTAEAAAAGCVGVCIVLSHGAEVSLLDWIPVDNRLCAVRLATSVKESHKRQVDRCLFIVSAYAPTDYSSDAIKDRFYDGLNALLRRTKSSDIAVVPGDMNAQLGRPSVSETQLGGRHGLDSGCILSPFLFNCVIDQILKRTVEGLQNNGVEIAANEDLVDLEYTNDIVLVFEEEGKAQVFLNELTEIILSFGMHFVSTKCKVMLLDMQSLDTPGYNPGRGNCFSSDYSATDEVNVRIYKARVAFANLRHLWCQSGASLNLKDMCIGIQHELFSFVAETWPVRAAEVRILQVVDNRCLGTIARVCCCRLIRNEAIRKRAFSCAMRTSIEECVRNQVRWLSHVLLCRTYVFRSEYCVPCPIQSGGINLCLTGVGLSPEAP
ncbi:hypothetical protein T265_09491 [Opisthorchis viverrini]|uniref:[phosphatase 2A protein]-leucine-carboxy methyltransferase n=1 Tax=Opisthorchis viverrini TaxID=6198 RepID=A0A074ZA07_OPIVI|nr:hypothetical protein T265_09491 [Opisthorchis viverrini]KER22412.1 hypothetical protein T265_09491 [Opisthorchis viverrini]